MQRTGFPRHRLIQCAFATAPCETDCLATCLSLPLFFTSPFHPTTCRTTYFFYALLLSRELHAPDQSFLLAAVRCVIMTQRFATYIL